MLGDIAGKRSSVEAVTPAKKSATIELRTRDEGGRKRNLADPKGSDDGRSMIDATLCLE